MASELVFESVALDAIKSSKRPSINKSHGAYDAAILAVTAEQPIIITPREGQTARGEALKLSYAAKRVGRQHELQCASGVLADGRIVAYARIKPARHGKAGRPKKNKES